MNQEILRKNLEYLNLSCSSKDIKKFISPQLMDNISKVSPEELEINIKKNNADLKQIYCGNCDYLFISRLEQPEGVLEIFLKTKVCKDINRLCIWNSKITEKEINLLKQFGIKLKRAVFSVCELRNQLLKDIVCLFSLNLIQLNLINIKIDNSGSKILMKTYMPSLENFVIENSFITKDCCKLLKKISSQKITIVSLSYLLCHNHIFFENMASYISFKENIKYYSILLSRLPKSTIYLFLNHLAKFERTSLYKHSVTINGLNHRQISKLTNNMKGMYMIPQATIEMMSQVFDLWWV